MGASSPYFVQTILWIAFGFVAGWVTGEIVRRRTLNGLSFIPIPAKTTPKVEVDSKPRFDRRLVIIGLLILALVTATFISSEIGLSDSKRAADAERAFVVCQREQNRQYSDTLNRRSAENGKVNQAQIELLETPTTASIEQRLAAVKKYLDALKALEQSRSETPLVVVPCEEP